MLEPDSNSSYFPPPVEEYSPDEELATPKPNRIWPLRLTVGLCCFVAFLFVLPVFQQAGESSNLARARYLIALLRCSPLVVVAIGLLISTLRLKSSSFTARLVAWFTIAVIVCMSVALFKA